MVPWRQVPEKGCYDAETCSNGTQYDVCSDGEINGMWFVAFSRIRIQRRTLHSQATSDYDPSFVTEALREIQYSDNPNQDINLLKDVAAQAYLG